MHFQRGGNKEKQQDRDGLMGRIRCVRKRMDGGKKEGGERKGREAQFRPYKYI